MSEPLTDHQRLDRHETSVGDAVPRRAAAFQHWILDGHTPVPMDDGTDWAGWFETANRHVALTALTPTVTVSTVFLSLDHNFSGHGPPLLFETMAFGLPEDATELCERYATWAEAEAGHRVCCGVLTAALLAAGTPLPDGYPQALDPHTLAPQAGTTPAPALPHPGFLCERCLDAPASTMAPAPWGGEMGLCVRCARRPPEERAHGREA